MRSRDAVGTANRGGLAPALGVGLILLGCYLALYLVGLLLIPVGLWLRKRDRRRTEHTDGGVPPP